MVYGELGQLTVLKCRSGETFAEEMEGTLFLCAAVLFTQIEIARAEHGVTDLCNHGGVFGERWWKSEFALGKLLCHVSEIYLIEHAMVVVQC